MQFSTVFNKPAVASNAALIVSLFLILLTIFIILSHNSSYDPNKMNLVKQSVEDIFGTKKKDVIFGRLANLKLDDYFIQIDKIVKSYGSVVTSNDEDKLEISIPLQAIYYSDEYNFRSERMDDMMQLITILKNWSDNENIHIKANLSETVFELDLKRLDFFRRNIAGENPLIGLKISKDKRLDIVIERKI